MHLGSNRGLRARGALSVDNFTENGDGLCHWQISAALALRVRPAPAEYAARRSHPHHPVARGIN